MRLLLGDCVEEMRLLDEASIDAVVTDPPYGLRFMGKDFDALGDGPAQEEWHRRWAVEALRVLKPGGHLIAFGGSRTSHRLVCAVEDAGFEVRDCLSWLYCGFPKSLDVSKALDRAAGAERRVVGVGRYHADRGTRAMSPDWAGARRTVRSDLVTVPATSAAEDWAGFGTALKPAHEPICLARKPLDGTVAGNCVRHGVGAINVDGCRVSYASTSDRDAARYNAAGPTQRARTSHAIYEGGKQTARDVETHDDRGRFPANVLLSHGDGCRLVGTRTVRSGNASSGSGFSPVRYGDPSHVPARVDLGGGHASGDGTEEVEVYLCEPDCPIRLLDEQSGRSRSSARPRRNTAEAHNRGGSMHRTTSDWTTGGYRDEGGASRFYYCGKAPTSERWAYCRTCDEAFRKREAKAHRAEDGHDVVLHPTVKPIDVMRWLVRLVGGRPGNVILDPFAGSGTTIEAALAEGFDAVGIERDPEYHRIAVARVLAARFGGRP